MVQNLNVGEPFETSDHQQIRWKLISNRDKVEKNLANFNYFKANYEEVRAFIKTKTWESSLVGADIESLWTKLKNKLNDIRGKSVPKKRTSKKQFKVGDKEGHQIT